MTERPGDVEFTGAAGSYDQCRGALGVAPGGELVDKRAVELGQAFEVELLERLGRAESGPT
jgi:hypothetical protein